MRTFVVGLCALTACSGEPAVDAQNPADSVAAAAAEAEDLVMPELPAPRGEHLVTAAVSTRRDIDASGTWRATARLCRTPPLVQLVAQEPLFQAIVVFAFPEDGSAVGVYDIVEGNADLPDSATARVGVQVYPEGERPAAFVGFEGTVEIAALDATLVGHVSVVAAEPRYFDTLFLAGAFDVPVGNASEAACRVMGEPLD